MSAESWTEHDALAAVEAERDLLMANVRSMTLDLAAYRTLVKDLKVERATLRRLLDDATRIGLDLADDDWDGTAERCLRAIRAGAGL